MDSFKKADIFLASSKKTQSKPIISPIKKKKERRHKAEWRTIGEVRAYFRSSWETNYAYYLEWLKSRGEITHWLHEPIRFDFEKIKRGSNSYLPDFQVFYPNGRHEFHEVKGHLDSVSKTKINRFRKYYSNEKLVLIDSKTYKQMAKQLSRIVPGWE